MTPEILPHDANESSSSNTPQDNIGEELKRLSVASIEAFNEKDFEYSETADRREFLTRVSPTFEARIERYPDVLPWNGLQNLWQNFAKMEPACRFEILNTTADVFTNGRASVLVETSTSVHEGVTYMRMMEMKWRSINANSQLDVSEVRHVGAEEREHRESVESEDQKKLIAS